MQHVDLVIANLIVNTVGLVLSILGIITILTIKVIRGRYFHIIMSVFTGNIILLAANFAEMAVNMNDKPGLSVILQIAVFLQFIMGYVMAFFFTAYVLYKIEETDAENNLKSVKMGFAAYYGLAIMSVIVSLFNHMYYYIDAERQYQRGHLYWLSQVVALIGLIALCLICIKYFSRITKKERKILCGLMGLPILVVLVQSCFEGLYFMSVLGIFIGVIIFIEVLLHQEQERQKKNAEISGMQIKIMLSQIQPHFLYNSLTTAQYLCETEPDKAAAALEHLTQFLRGNIDSLKIQTLVPFEKERFHVENYLYLEFLRFGDKLKVEWDIQCTDFALPTLTVQPIVENAVKYGVLRKPEGGLVKISTSKDDQNYYIDVVDDGVGFDMMETKYDGRTHIGLTNVKKRLKEQCGAHLDATSVPGKGTSVRITIPKESQI